MMELQADFSIPKSVRGTVVTVGVFDGVHLGHQYLLKSVNLAARRQKLSSAVLTFRNHPRSVLNPDHSVQWLTSLNDRISLISSAGIEHVAVANFTRDFSLLTAEEFVMGLKKALKMVHMVIGPNFAMGYRREGTFPVLKKLGLHNTFSVEQITPFEINGTLINSTGIRAHLASGDVEKISSYLGRYFSITGNVEHGEGRGSSQLGFPTINLRIDESQAIPAEGIYAACVDVKGIRYIAAASIGRKPTFYSGGRLVVEAHLLDYSGDLYDQRIKLNFVKHIREQKHFDNSEALILQMSEDIVKIRDLMSSLPALYNPVSSQFVEI